MKRLSTRLLWPVLACVTLSPLAAESPDLKDLLRDALYKEEVNRDPEGAAKAYQNLLARNDGERAFAATAQFRLAEVRRKQGRKDDAIAAYRLLLTRYPEAETECKLARENLAGLGAGEPVSPNPLSQAATPAPTGDEAFLATLREMEQTSPDKLAAKGNFEQAIAGGYSKSLAFLLEKGTPTEQIPILTMAVQAGSLEMVRLILKSGIPIQAGERKQVLPLAASLNQYYIAQELLKQIDVNGNPDLASWGGWGDVADKNLSPGTILGPALTTAVGYGNSKLIETFLKANPDVNLQNTRGGYTALHFAALSKNTTLVKELLARRANPNLAVSNSSQATDRGWTALDFALQAGDDECITLLVKAGGRATDPSLLLSKSSSSAKTNWNPRLELMLNAGLNAADLPDPHALLAGASMEQAKTLLKLGLDPNRDDGRGNFLSTAIANRNFDLAKLLLDAGAKPGGSPGNSPNSAPPRPGEIQKNNLLLSAANNGAPLDLLEELIAKGATPDEAGPRDGSWSFYSDHTPAGTRTLLFRHFKLPRMTASQDVRVVYQSHNYPGVANLEDKSPSAHPKSLEELLVSPKVPVVWQIQHGKLGPEKITIWRTAPDGTRTALEADMRQDTAFPALEWGDIVELSYRPEDQSVFSESNTVETQERLPDETTWKMRKRISFPITIEMNGRTRELTMRGDLVIFDPTRKEVPLMGAAQLARLFSGENPDMEIPETVGIIRQGWPEVRVISVTAPNGDFALTRGDRLKWDLKNRAPQTAPNNVLLYSPGLPFALSFTGENLLIDDSVDRLARPTQPSLLQAIATAYAPEQLKLKGAPTGSPESLDGWLAGGFEQKILSVLPFPDLSKIRIHRRIKDGGEKVIEVNLQQVCDAMTDRTTTAEARQADVLLQAGDRVELPVAVEKDGKPWTGFSASRAALLGKALSCTVQYEANGGIVMRTIIYHPPHFMVTPGGVVPLPATEGDSSVLASDILTPGEYEASSQDGSFPSLPGDRTFLSERFRYRLTQEYGSLPIGPQPARRIVRPPSNSNQPQPAPHR